MLILAFDTSSRKGGVALLQNEITLATQCWDRSGSHGEFLTPAIESCLTRAGVPLSRVDALAISHGPGSFTGVRVAVNAARSLAFALDRSVYAFDSTEVLAAAVPHAAELPVLTLINAHKNMVYASSFVRGHRDLQLEAFTMDRLEKRICARHLCVGDGYLEFERLLSPRLKGLLERDSAIEDWPNSETLGQLAYRERERRAPLGWKEVQALYIRASGAEENLREDLGKKP